MVENRIKVAGLGAAVAASWPSAIAAVMLRVALRSSLLPGQTLRIAFVAAWVLSALCAAVVAWCGAPSARRTPGLWMLYGVVAAFPISSLWAALGEASLGVGPGRVALSAVTVWFYGMPINLAVGFGGGCQLAYMLRRKRWSMVLGVSYGVAIAIAVVFKV